MTQKADVIVVGAGVQGASLAFHLARRGADVLVLERSPPTPGATARSTGFVRMHYDFEPEARLAWASFPTFEHWSELVGAGDCAMVACGFVQLVPPDLAESLRANVAMLRRIGIDTRTIGPGELAELVPGIVTDDVVVAAYEPRSGYADPSATAAGFLVAARRWGARLLEGCRVTSVLVDGDRVTGVETDRGRFGASIVVDAAGAWAAELARTVGLELPVQAWRHDTAVFGLPSGRDHHFPGVLDHALQVYFRPEGRSQVLVGLETANQLGGSPDRLFAPIEQGVREELELRVTGRAPWMAEARLRTTFVGQDGMTPDQRPIIGSAGPEGFFLLCGFSGTGFKTAPAIGLGLSERILDGESSSVDLSAFGLERFKRGEQPSGPHPYGHLWR